MTLSRRLKVACLATLSLTSRYNRLGPDWSLVILLAGGVDSEESCSANKLLASSIGEVGGPSWGVTLTGACARGCNFSALVFRFFGDFGLLLGGRDFEASSGDSSSKLIGLFFVLGLVLGLVLNLLAVR